MNKIIALVKKDILQLKNTKGKKIIDILSTFLIIWGISWSGSFINYYNNGWMMDDILLFVIVTCSLLSFGMLFIHRDIRDGLYEQLYLMQQIKDYQIFISKLIINFLFVTLVILFLNYILNPINIMFGAVGYYIDINIFLLFKLLLLVSIFTTTSFILNIYIKSEQNITIIYVLPISFGLIYKGLELISLNTQVAVYIVLFILNLVLIWITCKVISSSKLIIKNS